ncbi:hypothetical protein SI65_02273 [Aspergillus cristatus]|uniref:Uncharacterized protein n=1 Tax=Aspergillus cristatus TaxID=573508 RepID=A0A1E3BKG8_ASPCR|nr:hypothetical protein SI65_02273 [Aspergillus cristatus]
MMSYLPRDPEKLIMGHPNKWPELPIPMELRSDPNSDLHDLDAYAMHEQCWTLITRIIDVDLIMENLELFVKAFYRQSRENGLGLVWGDPEEYSLICEKRMSRIEGCLKLSYSPRDPFNVPEVRQLFSHPEKIQRPKTKKQKELRRERTEQEPSLNAVGEVARKSRLPRSHPSLSSCKVPAEITLMIMNYLYEYLNILDMIRVFPQYRSMISQVA